MRTINRVVIHCSDSDNPKHDDIRIIDQWHKERGWESPSGIHCGYHWFINKSGIIQQGRPESEIGSHVKGHNQDSIGVCLSGRYHFYKGQVLALKRLFSDIRLRYGDVQILGHKDLDPKKTCPNISMDYVRSMIAPYVRDMKDPVPLAKDEPQKVLKKKPAPKKKTGKGIQTDPVSTDKLKDK